MRTQQELLNTGWRSRKFQELLQIQKNSWAFCYKRNLLHEHSRSTAQLAISTLIKIQFAIYKNFVWLNYATTIVFERDCLNILFEISNWTCKQKSLPLYLLLENKEFGYEYLALTSVRICFQLEFHLLFQMQAHFGQIMAISTFIKIQFAVQNSLVCQIV